MELVRRNSDYALRSLAFISGFPAGKKFTIELLAKKQDLPAVYLRKIFQKLSKRKIVTGKRGPEGGFYLLKRPAQISLKDILESLQGPISISDCLFESNVCNRQRSCRIKQGLSSIQKNLISLLDKYTLKDFVAHSG